MTGDKKIVAIAKDQSDHADDQIINGDEDTREERAESLEWEDPLGEFEVWDEDRHLSTISTKRRLLQLGLALAAIGWSGFFGWSVYQRNVFPLAPSAAIDLITQYSIPLILIVAIYLLAMRNSTAEAQKFARITRSISDESRALEDRLTVVNGELSIAREFLANQARELESLGRVSTDRLMEFGEKLRDVIQGSDEKLREIGAVSETSASNLEKLRAQLPVIANSAKDVTNQIGNAGRTAQSHVIDLQNAFTRLDSCEQDAGKAIAELEEHTNSIRESLSNTIEAISHDLKSSGEAVLAQAENGKQSLNEQVMAVESMLSDAGNALESRAATTQQSVQDALAAVTAQLGELEAVSTRTDKRLTGIMSAAEHHVETMDARLSAFDEDGSAKIARLAFALSAVDDDLTRLATSLSEKNKQSEQFVATAESLLAILQRNREAIENDLTAAMDRLQTQSTTTQKQVDTLLQDTDQIFKASDTFTDQMVVVGESLAVHQKYIDEMAEQSETLWSKRNDDLITLTANIKSVREETAALAQVADTRLVESLRDIQQRARDTRDDVRSTLQQVVGDTAKSLSSKSAAALESVVRGKAEEIVGKLESAIDRAVGATSDATMNLRDQLIKVDELTLHLERRVSEAREKAEENSDSGFARRVALLNESLNSTSIDIAKILNKEVSDTSWAAYLKGDRGVFTRRAVRLLDNNEAKEIGQFYENDVVFYDQVNRFIHDFEAMLRSVLSTREGSVMSVTLLSSDMGKLYVALAQAIERFRQ